MELPKLNYDDFYKFLMSLGIILVVITGVGIFFLLKDLLSAKIIILIIVLILILGSGAWIIIWASKKWYKNQKLLDKKLETEVKLIELEHEASQIIRPQEGNGKQMLKEKKTNGTVKTKERSSVALVSYKIASVLPNSVSFDFLKDWKVWFWILNHDPKKYKAYVKVRFIADDFEKEVTDGYYGGTQAWKLDAFSGIQAPGLGIPEEVKASAREEKRIKIQINCTVKDENDNLIEEKFPQTYVYDPTNNSWFLEP